MTYKAIPIEGYYLMISDEELKPEHRAFQNPKTFEMFGFIGQSEQIYEGIPLFDAPWEEDVELTANEIKNIAEQHFSDTKFLDENQKQDNTFGFRIGFKNGYNAAKAKYEFTREDMEEAMKLSANAQRNIIQNGFWGEPNSFDKDGKVIWPLDEVNDEACEMEITCKTAGNYAGTYGNTLPDFNSIIQSLKKQKVYEVVIEETITNNKITIKEWKEIN